MLACRGRVLLVDREPGLDVFANNSNSSLFDLPSTRRTFKIDLEHNSDREEDESGPWYLNCSFPP